MIGVDWGTTSLRAYRLGPDGAVTDRLDRPGGILTVPEGGFPDAFRDAVGPWLAAGEGRVRLYAPKGTFEPNASPRKSGSSGLTSVRFTWSDVKLVRISSGAGAADG